MNEEIEDDLEVIVKIGDEEMSTPIYGAPKSVMKEIETFLLNNFPEDEKEAEYFTKPSEDFWALMIATIEKGGLNDAPKKVGEYTDEDISTLQVDLVSIQKRICEITGIEVIGDILDLINGAIEAYYRGEAVIEHE